MFHVVLAPQKVLSEPFLKTVAALVGKEIYDTRLLLSGEIPKIIASCQERGAADSIGRGLRDAGMAALVCTDSDLQNSPACFLAHTARAGEREVIFGDRRGSEVRLEEANAFLIMRGRRQVVMQEETTTTKMKLNVAATVLTGGLPIMRRVKNKTTKEKIQVEDFVRIFGARRSDPCVEMFENHIEYAFLGPELTPSTPGNFAIVIKKLREWFPRAIYDERLIRHFQDDALINSNLIYLCHLAAQGLTFSGTRL